MFYKTFMVRFVAVAIICVLSFSVIEGADNAPVAVTITKRTPIETLSPNGNVVGVSEATIGTQLNLVGADASRVTLQDAQGIHYRIALSSTDYSSASPVASTTTNSASQTASSVITTPLVVPPTNAASPAAPAPLAASPATSLNTSPAANKPPVDSGGTPLLLDYEIQPRDNFSKAAFRFWSPSYDQPIRGVIVLVPGLNGDGRGKVTDPAWQDLARKYRLALVACFLQGGAYYDAAKGTGDALRDALKDFAQKAARPEIALAPLLLYGESAGGQFNYDFVLWKPDQVMAFVVNKGGYYDHGAATSQIRSIPGLFFLGQKDSDLRIHAITEIWTEGREQGALWALAPQPNSGHEFSKTAPVARIFFDAVLRSRLPEISPASGEPPRMNMMQESQGWIGDLNTHEIHDGSTDGKPNYKASWLPDESSAKAWKAFVSGGA
jgi:hypothetical protein